MMAMLKKLFVLVFCVTVCTNWCQARQALDIELTRGMSAALPIVIMPFHDETQRDGALTKLTTIIKADLNHSGRFHVYGDDNNQLHSAHIPKDIDIQFWKQKNIDHIVVGKIKDIGANQISIQYRLVDVFNGGIQTATPGKRAPVLSQDQILLDGSVRGATSNIRQLAHRISDQIYQALLGDKGIFSTKIAYVEVYKSGFNTNRYALKVADADGYNPQILLDSPEPLMSPAWSPDAKQIAYVSFERKRSHIYISELKTGARQLVADFPGINGAPSWSPDGKKIAFTLSKDGNPNIYIYNLVTKRVEQHTFDNAISTEPSFSPDGQSLIFTSDRGGSPQIYQLKLANNQVTRLTFDGNYNASASYAPEGDQIVMLHRDENAEFVVATLDLQSGRVTSLSRDGHAEHPSFAPNGQMILYSTRLQNRQILSLVSKDGNVSLQLPSVAGSVQEPAWSPFIS